VSVSTVAWNNFKQMELRPEQVQELIDFLVGTLPVPRAAG
jgi:hypothetical protein